MSVWESFAVIRSDPGFSNQRWVGDQLLFSFSLYNLDLQHTYRVSSVERKNVIIRYQINYNNYICVQETREEEERERRDLEEKQRYVKLSDREKVSEPSLSV